MTELVQPGWMEGFAPSTVRGNPDWKRGGPSPNKAGRPKGIVDKRMKVTKALEDDAPAIARVVIDAALEGDLQACSLVLARVAPALRSESRTVTFDFDPTMPITEQIEAVLSGIGSGAVPVDVGKQIIEAIGTLGAARRDAELEARLAALEDKARQA